MSYALSNSFSRGQLRLRRRRKARRSGYHGFEDLMQVGRGQEMKLTNLYLATLI